MDYGNRQHCKNENNVPFSKNVFSVYKVRRTFYFAFLSHKMLLILSPLARILSLSLLTTSLPQYRKIR